MIDCNQSACCNVGALDIYVIACPEALSFANVVGILLSDRGEIKQ